MRQIIILYKISTETEESALKKGVDTNMDGRPIGVFDSGLGGLTMVKALTSLLPGEDIVYLGDTGRVPYGPRSRETIMKYAAQDAEFLVSLDIKAMVIACNTVSGVAFEKLKKAYDIPIYEVIKTPARLAVEKTKNKKIGVIGTAATVRSEAYDIALYEQSAKISVYPVACPLFVPLVEEGWTDRRNEAAVNIAEKYLSGLKKKKIDTLILGCTHYSLLSGVIAKVMGKSVKLIDSGAETAKYVAKDMESRGLLRDTTKSGKKGTIDYYVTDSTKDFSEHASRFLGSDIHGKVKQVSLD